MIYLTFTWDRDVFRGDVFVSWIKNYFPSAKFEGYGCGRYHPTISVDLIEFQENCDKIPSRNLRKVRGEFTFLQSLVYNVRDFCNEIE